MISTGVKILLLAAAMALMSTEMGQSMREKCIRIQRSMLLVCLIIGLQNVMDCGVLGKSVVWTRMLAKLKLVGKLVMMVGLEAIQHSQILIITLGQMSSPSAWPFQEMVFLMVGKFTMDWIQGMRVTQSSIVMVMVGI